MAKAGTGLIDEKKRRVANLASAAGWQAMGRRLEQVISEFLEVVKVQAPKAEFGHLVRLSRLKSGAVIGGQRIPEESQVLQVGPIPGGDASCEVWELAVGVPWSPVKFLEEARRLKHPLAFHHAR
jgi:hypothetical protein